MDLFPFLKKSKEESSPLVNPPFWAYRQVLHNIRTYGPYQSASPKERLAFLEFVMEVLKRDIQGSYLTEFFKEQHPVQGWRLFPIPFFLDEQQPEKRSQLPLEKKTVISLPRETSRMFSAVQNIREEGFRYTKDMTTGQYFPELEMVIIVNGQHHVAAATILDKAFADVEIYHLADAFPIMKVSDDGTCWEPLSGSDVKSSVEVLDTRFALLYELCREASELKSSMGN